MLKHFGKGFAPGRAGVRGTGVTHCARGVPILKDAIGHMECEPAGNVDSGDHRIFLANVVRGKLHDDEATPMIHVRKSGAKY